jgi:AcrR family transcriptional regulator
MSDISTPDRRVRKTKAALGQAMMGLLRKTPWDDITIQMICDRADVARSSFYAHFDGKIDLLDEVIALQLAAAQSDPAQGDGLRSLHWLVAHIVANRAFFLRMALSMSGQVVFTRFRLAVRQLLIAELADRQPPVPPEIATFIIGGSFEVIQRWTLDGQDTSAADLMQMLQRTAAQVMNPGLGPDGPDRGK